VAADRCLAPRAQKTKVKIPSCPTETRIAMSPAGDKQAGGFHLSG
jgi:hypothetical protein